MQMQRAEQQRHTHEQHTYKEAAKPTLLETVLLHTLAGVRLEISTTDNRNDARRMMIARNVARTAALRHQHARALMIHRNRKRAGLLRERFGFGVAWKLNRAIQRNADKLWDKQMQKEQEQYEQEQIALGRTLQICRCGKRGFNVCEPV